MLVLKGVFGGSLRTTLKIKTTTRKVKNNLKKSEENKEHPKTHGICVFGCVAFSGALCSPLRGHQNTPENATHPKSQIPGTTRYSRFRVCCVFGCVLAPAKKDSLGQHHAKIVSNFLNLSGSRYMATGEQCEQIRQRTAEIDSPPKNRKQTTEVQKRSKTTETLRAQRLKIFKITLRDWNFQSRLKFSSEPPSKPLFLWGNSEGRDWKFQSRLNISSEIEMFNRDWIFPISIGPLGKQAKKCENDFSALFCSFHGYLPVAIWRWPFRFPLNLLTGFRELTAFAGL